MALLSDDGTLYAADGDSNAVSVISTAYDTASKSLDGSFNVGYGGYPNSGDGDEPTGIVLTSTPTPGS